MKLQNFFCSLVFFFGITWSMTLHGQSKLLQAKGYLDVESGELMTPAQIVVEDGLITAINPATVDNESEIIDLSDLILLPGLIDVHTHLTMDLEAMRLALKETSADWALRGAKNAKITLMAGFTTVRDVGSNGFSDVSLSKAVQRGFVPGPAIFPVGHAIGSTGGHMDLTGFAPGVAEPDYRAGVGDGADDLIKATRYQIKHGAKAIKIGATAGVLSFEGPVGAQQLTMTEMKAIVEEANRHGLKVAAHSHGKDGMLAAVQAGVHSIEHASMIDDDVIAAMKEHGTYLVPTSYIPYGINWDALPPLMVKKGRAVSAVSEANLTHAIKAGVKVAFGTDAGVFPHGDNAKEFSILTKMGMTELEAIQSATLAACDLLGVEDRGILKKDYRADIIGVSLNPLSDISTLEDVKFVMKAGEVFKYQRL